MSNRLGIVMLIHTALDRAEQVVRLWAKAGCPVVIHLDKAVPNAVAADFQARVSALSLVSFSERFRCEWGTWSIVAATQAACAQLLAEHEAVRHVYLVSGSCLPLRPVHELSAYLDARPQTDFIESATIEDVSWTVGGLERERFTLRFPFSWKRQRAVFDAYVDFQRKLGWRRAIPAGLNPHIGSQWWCLTRETLSAVLQDPDRAQHDRYFRQVWIPDESYFQTLVRRHTRHIESRSLTLSKFDFQGKPHIFYDDHLQLLRRSDCFVARKIWPHAERLYDTFLSDDPSVVPQAEPNPAKIDRVFRKAVQRRTRGRAGLYMQSRFPNPRWENGITASPYSVFEGFSEVFEDFENWLRRLTEAQVHGHLFDLKAVEFADHQTTIAGGLGNSVKQRDYNPEAFLSNLIWNGRGVRQCFQFGPQSNQEITWRMVMDPNAHISVISGAWAIPLYRMGGDFQLLRKKAAQMQRIERAHLEALRATHAKARVRIWTLAEFMEGPVEPLQTILDEIAPNAVMRPSETPEMVDMTGFADFLRSLKNEGMHPYLMGDFPIESADRTQRTPVQRKPYLAVHR